MSLKNLIRPLPAGGPDGNPCVSSGGCHPTILQESNRIHRIGVKSKDLLGGFGLERPSDGGGVEAARKNTVTVAGNRDRPHGSTVTRQLRLRRR